jgi:hypothetical protein
VLAIDALPHDPGARDEDPSYAREVIEAADVLLAADADVEWTELSAARTRLWEALTLVAPSTLAALHYRVTSAEHTGGVENVVCFGELVFLAVLRVTWLQVHTRAPSATRVADLRALPPSIVSSALYLDRAVEEFSLSELMATLQTMRTAFVEIAYTDDLLVLVELVEITAARMIFETASSDVFDLEPPLVRHCGAEPIDDEFCITTETIRMIWPSLIGFHRRIIETRCFLEENVDAPPCDPARVRRLREWFHERAAGDACREPSHTLRRVFVSMHLGPGDRELHRLQYPQVTTSDAGIVSRTLGDARMSDVNKRSGFSPAVCIRDQLVLDAPTNVPESLELGVCMYDVMESWTQGTPGCPWALHYARVEVLMDPDEVQRISVDYPLVVQLFNAWQLVFQRRVYWHNNAAAAIVHWLELLDESRRGGWRSESPAYRAAVASPVYGDLVRRVLFPPPPPRAPIVAADPRVVEQQ